MSSQRKVSALVLMEKSPFPIESPPTPDEVYDLNLQIWISGKTGVPLVLEARNERVDTWNTPFGETLMTETREGTDQSEGAHFAISPSPFGETLLTKTVEGTDQRESVDMSRFGETMVTFTREGTDQHESSEDTLPTKL